MNFEDKFKPNDVICSDDFYNGKLMIVKSLREGFRHHNGKHIRYYSCEDLFLLDQSWCAYEHGLFKSNEWRLATDEDYVKQITAKLRTVEEISSFFEVIIDADGLTLNCNGDYLCLEPNEAKQLERIIAEHVKE